VALLLNENSCSPAPKSTFVSAGRETPVETTRQEDKFDSRSLSCLAAPPEPRATAGCGECRFVANWTVIRHGFAQPGVLAPRSMRLLPGTEKTSSRRAEAI